MIDQLKNILKKASIFYKKRPLKALRSDKNPADHAPNVLIWRGPGKLTSSLNIELLLATALRERGANVTFLLCDGTSIACVARTIEDEPKVENWKHKCSACHYSGAKAFENMDFHYYSTNEFIDDADKVELRNIIDKTDISQLIDFKYHDIEVGLFAVAAAIRFFKGVATNDDDPYYQSVIKEYFYTALINTVAAENVLKDLEPHRILIQHGIYADWGPFHKVMLNADLPVTIWMRSYLKNHLYIRSNHKDDIYHIYFPPKDYINLDTPLTSQQNAALDAFFESQVKGKKNTHQYSSHDPLEAEALRKKLGFDNDKPIWALFTHLNWDAQFSFEAMIFPDTTTWVLKTLEIMKTVTSVNWVIKIHPAERILGTAMGVGAEIEAHFGTSLPNHIKILRPDTDINTYGLLPVIAGGLTISGTVGMELAVRGKPTILGGEAHYGRRGFTLSHDSEPSYNERIKNVANIPPLSEEQKALARRYCHYFFIQRQLPFELVDNNGADILISSKKPLEKGQHRSVDMICERILEGGEFILT